ncbi:MAG: lipoyl synthase [Desulfatirhabdiaceae bacterium]
MLTNLDHTWRKPVTAQLPKPEWLRRRLPASPEYEKMRKLIQNSCLHTVCQEACCPNQWECFSEQTAAFLIMGPVCTRDCRFCAVSHGIPKDLDPDEPSRVADAARSLGLTYVVVTSVTRDDLPDGGASCFARTIGAIRHAIPQAGIEVLIPDFQGDSSALKIVLQAGPTVLNHNIETVPRLYFIARPQAVYTRSLALLAESAAHSPHIPVKSGLMLGMGETEAEIVEVLEALRAHGCTRLTLGQYLQPGRNHLPVERYVPPQEFEHWRQTALKMGFVRPVCGPFVRSSYHAGDM